MSAITLTPDRDFAALARTFNERTTRKMIVAGVNAAGKEFRTSLPTALQTQLQARKIKSRSRARAAFAGSATPRYRLTMPKYIPPTDLRTLKFTRRGRGRKDRSVVTSFRDWDRSKIVFARTRKEGKGSGRKIRLLAAGKLGARNVGGIPIPRSILDDRSKFPGPAAIPAQARDKAVAAMALAVNKALASRR